MAKITTTSNAALDLEPNGTGDINLTPGTNGDVNIPAKKGITFGNDGEKIEGNATKLDIAAAEIDFSIEADGDINIGTDIGLTFGADGEKIEGNGTKLDIAAAEIDFSIEADGDINIGTDIGLTFGDDGEKIEGDGTDLTIASSAVLNVNTGSSAGNDLKVNTSQLVVEGDTGNVGIGTSTPGTNRLYVTKSGASEYVAMFENTEGNGTTTGTGQGIHVKCAGGGTYVARFENTRTNTGNGIHIVSANTSASGQEAIKLDVNSVQKCLLTMGGDLTIAGSYSPFTATHTAKIPDYNNDYQYGELVEIISVSSSGFEVSYVVRKTTSSYQKTILGAYRKLIEKSDVDPKIKDTDEDQKFAINVLGDGHILCSSENGNIEIGDGIASSSTAGQGMKADSGTYIFGIAQENHVFSGSETKLIAVQYGLKKY